MICCHRSGVNRWPRDSQGLLRMNDVCTGVTGAHPVILREGEGSIGRSEYTGTLDPRPAPRMTIWGSEDDGMEGGSEDGNMEGMEQRRG